MEPSLWPKWRSKAQEAGLLVSFDLKNRYQAEQCSVLTSTRAKIPPQHCGVSLRFLDDLANCVEEVTAVLPGEPTFTTFTAVAKLVHGGSCCKLPSCSIGTIHMPTAHADTHPASHTLLHVQGVCTQQLLYRHPEVALVLLQAGDPRPQSQNSTCACGT